MSLKSYKVTSLFGQEEKADCDLVRPVSNALSLSFFLMMGLWSAQTQAAVPVISSVIGEIEEITLNDPASKDHWQGGAMIVGGQHIIIPRNLLIDLPANRVTLQQLYDDAPASCLAKSESGLAKKDLCNTTGAGGIATIAANRTSSGNVIAGDVLIEKAVESVAGQITFINYDQGYFRINGTPDIDTAGIMVRINDPTSRHTKQIGPTGCLTAKNCSADPRFALDADNYTNTFIGGFPLCIPSTIPRAFIDTLNLGVTTAQASATGLGDVLCLDSNRPGPGLASADSRRFAPIMVGDHITVEGNYEDDGTTRFLSAHTSKVSAMLSTKNTAGQPDYMEFEEAFIDAPGFQNKRARSLFIGFVTNPTPAIPNRTGADVMIWSVHYDPTTNQPHEFPLATTQGCDIAIGKVGQCTNQGVLGLAGAANIFRIKHDVDFILNATQPAKVKPDLNPCAHLMADPRFSAIQPALCSPAGANGMTGTFEEQFAVLSPIPHEIQARTGRKYADIKAGNLIKVVDIEGHSATWGQYLMPFGIGLGGIDMPNFLEIDLNKLTSPMSFSGIPWNLDRRLSPGGCSTNASGAKVCETSAQPLSPFPYEESDPRLLESTLPNGSLSVGGFASKAYIDVRDRILSYVSATQARLPATVVGSSGNAVGVNDGGNFSGDNILALPGVPTALPINPIAFSGGFLACTTTPTTPTTNHAPVAVADNVTSPEDTSVSIAVLANDTDQDVDPLSVSGVTAATNGLVTINAGGLGVSYLPKLNYNGLDSFTYTISDGKGGSATATVSLIVSPVNDAPVAGPDSALTITGGTISIPVLTNDTDVDVPKDTLTVSVAGSLPALGAVTTDGLTVTYKANAGTLSGTDNFSYVVNDGKGGSAVGNISVKVTAPVIVTDTVSVKTAEYTVNAPRGWKLIGSGTTAGKTVTLRLGTLNTGVIIGTALVGANNNWQINIANNGTAIGANTVVTAWSTGGGVSNVFPIQLK